MCAAKAHHSLAQLPLKTTVSPGFAGLASVSSVTTSLPTLDSSFSDVSGSMDTAEPLVGTAPSENAGPLAGTDTPSSCRVSPADGAHVSVCV